jgi:hypothetical protein
MSGIDGLDDMSWRNPEQTIIVVGAGRSIPPEALLRHNPEMSDERIIEEMCKIYGTTFEAIDTPDGFYVNAVNDYVMVVDHKAFVIPDINKPMVFTKPRRGGQVALIGVKEYPAGINSVRDRLLESSKEMLLTDHTMHDKYDFLMREQKEFRPKYDKLNNTPKKDRKSTNRKHKKRRKKR